MGRILGSDILIIGGGLAGAIASIKAIEAGVKKVMLVTKGRLGKDSVSTFAAGAWIIPAPEGDKDSFFRKIAFSDVFGGGLYDEEWLSIFLDENYDRLSELDRWGVEWEKTPEGKFEEKELRYKMKQCMFHGPQLMEIVSKRVTDCGVEVIDHTMVTDFLTENGKQGEHIIGAVGFGVRTGEFKVFKANATIVAAGGCGYKARFASHKMVTGEAAAMAYRAGCKLGHFDEGKLHTTSTNFDIQGLNMFVGLGGKFLNAENERFMLEYAPELGDHAGMATVSEAAAMEVRAGRGPIYLDMTHFTPEDVKKLRTVIPIPSKILERAGILVGDKIIKKIEWAPAFYGPIGMGGGILTNTRCESSILGLYACGDAMARTRSTAGLPMAAITGAIAGKFAAEHAKEAKRLKIDERQVGKLKKFAFAPLERKDGIEPDHVIIELHETLLPYEITVISRGDRLEKALKEIERIRDEEVPLLYAPDTHYLRLVNEVKSMVLVAEMYLKSRLLRKESRDSCLREDYPYTDNLNWLKTILLKQKNRNMELWAEDIPVEKYRVKPKREKYLYPVFEVAKRRGIKWG